MHRCGRHARALLLCCALLLAPWAWAGEIAISEARLHADADGVYVLSADLDFQLSRRLEEAVTRGVVLHFVAEFELTRQRWYWFDATLVQASRSWRLSYHALTRQFRLAGGALHQNFLTLEDALSALRHLRGWRVFDSSEVSADGSERAALRMRLDLAQLPRPFQIEALASREWNLSSDWVNWVFVAGEGN